MPMPSSVTFYRYFPETLDKETLRYLLVGRQKILDELIKEAEQTSQSGTPRFILLVGPRGIGKSHLMTLLYHRVRDELSGGIIPVKLAEEEYSIFRASDFFLRILEEMNVGTSDVIALEDDRAIRDAAVEKLKEAASTEGKRIVIFVENVHELFKQMDKQEIRVLRSVFQRTDTFSVFASAPLIFPGVADHDEPFYNFFRIFHLHELNPDEIKELMKKVAKTDGNTAFIENFEEYEFKIEGLSHLIGGSPRLVILFYEIIAKCGIDDIEKVFFKMMDEHTPYYQEIFQMLTGQRRVIFDTIINAETPLTPKEIAKRSRIDQATVNSQLRRLEADGYVISHPMKKRTSYEVRERLFRLWREVRKPLGRNRIFIFIEFLKAWYSPDERAAAFEMKLRELGSGNKNVLKEVCYYAESPTPESGAEDLQKIRGLVSEFGESEEARYSIEKVLPKGTELPAERHDKEDLERFEKAPARDPKFVRLCLVLAREELAEGNQANGLRLLDSAYTHADRLEPGAVKTMTIDFLKQLIQDGRVPVIKSAVNEIVRFRDAEYQWFLKPVTDAIEIIETKDTKLYYTKLQSEEREVVAEIVRKITKSDELLPKL